MSLTDNVDNVDKDNNDNDDNDKEDDGNITHHEENSDRDKGMLIRTKIGMTTSTTMPRVMGIVTADVSRTVMT